MKLRIRDNTVRFRITLRELEALESNGKLEKETMIPSMESPESPTVFTYSLCVAKDLKESRLVAGAFSLTAELSQEDFDTLKSETEEGVYVRKEWKDKKGTESRFMLFVEKDRPGSTCTKPEEWVYEHIPGSTPETRPIKK